MRSSIGFPFYIRVQESFRKKKNKSLLSIVFFICPSALIGDKANTSLVRSNCCKVLLSIIVITLDWV